MLELLLLRLVHVLGGLFWVGSALFNILFLMPVLQPLGPAAGPVMAGLQRRRMMVILPTVALLTILSGVRLMWITSNGFDDGYLSTATGATLSVAATAGILAWVLAMAFVRPSMTRVATLAPTMATLPEGPERARVAAELDRLRRRAGIVNRLGVVLLVIAASGMAVARYLH